jgi:hypothetical protein
MPTTHRSPAAPALLAAALALAPAPALLAQSQQRPPQRQVRTIKESPLDLRDQAKQRREGQVLPGDPSPERFARPIPPAVAAVSTLPERAPTAEPAPAAPIVPGAPGASGETPASITGAEAPLSPEPLVAAGSQLTLAGYEPAPEVVERRAARVRVVSIDGNAAAAEWRRAGDAAWNPFTGNVEVDGRFEVRTGIGAAVTLVADDAAEITVGRLARVLVENQVDPGGNVSVGVELARGRARVRPLSATPVNIRTPDQSIRVSSELAFEYNAFAGTRPAVLIDR